jgi:hypothetical protein
MSIARQIAFALLASTAILTGCEFTTHITERVPMDVGLREAHIEKVQWNNTRFIINAEITLHGVDPATLATADYVLKVGDATVATGSTHNTVQLVPGQPTIVGFPIEINYQRFIEAVKQRKDLIMPNGEVSATLSGKVIAHGKYGQLMYANEPIAFESSIAMPIKQDIWNGTSPTVTLPPK